MDRPIPIASLGGPVAGQDAAKAARPAAAGEGNFGTVLDEDPETAAPAGKEPTAPADPAANPGWPRIPDVLLPPPYGADAQSSASAAVETPGPSPQTGTAAQLEPAVPAVAPPPEAAVPSQPGPAAEAALGPATKRRVRGQAGIAPLATDGQTSQDAPSAAPAKRASRVGWVKGGAAPCAPGATSGTRALPGQKGRAQLQQVAVPSRARVGAQSGHETLPADLVASLRWIADPVPTRSAVLTAPSVASCPEAASQTPAAAPPHTPTSAVESPDPDRTNGSVPQPSGETELALDLAELGPVRLRIRDRRGRLALHVLADHPATLNLLRRHADELAGALHEAGLDPATLTWGRIGRPASPVADVAVPGPADPLPRPACRPCRDGDLDLVL